MTTPVRDLVIGRLGLPTVESSISELLGSEVQATGDATAVGQRRVKGFTLEFPIHGTAGDADPYAAGQAMRRRLRSMMQNPEYRLGGIYIQFRFDPERNGWFVMATGTLSDEPGGPTLAEYKLTLDQVFRVGAINSHREGFRCDVTDLRLSTSRRDILGQIQSTDFAALPNLPLFSVPAGATDISVLDSRVAALDLPIGGDGGTSWVVAGRSNGDVVSWERLESALNLSDVVAYDRRSVLSTPANLNIGDSVMTWTTPFGDGTHSTFTIVHGLGQQYPLVEVIDVASSEEDDPGITFQDGNTIVIDYAGTVPASNSKLLVLNVVGVAARGVAANPAATVPVTGVSQVIVPPNPARRWLGIWNDDVSAIGYLSLGGTAALDAGPRVNPNGDSWQTPTPNVNSPVYTGAVSAVATAPCNFTVSEL